MHCITCVRSPTLSGDQGRSLQAHTWEHAKFKNVGCHLLDAGLPSAFVAVSVSCCILFYCCQLCLIDHDSALHLYLIHLTIADPACLTTLLPTVCVDSPDRCQSCMINSTSACRLNLICLTAANPVCLMMSLPAICTWPLPSPLCLCLFCCRCQICLSLVL